MIEWNGAIGPYTAQKQRDFARVLEHLLPVIGSILRRHAWAAREVLYFDLTAGPGYYTSLDLEGSPLIWLRLAGQQDFYSRAFFFEADPATRAALEDYVAMTPQSLHARRHIIPGDHGTTLPGVLRTMDSEARQRFGLAYADPNGTEIPVIALQQISRQFPRVDLLTYVSATNYKRRRRADEIRNRGVRAALLEEHIAALGKRVWLVRQPLGPQQWTMLLGSNWPALKAMQAAGFYRLDTPEGRAILARLNYSKAETA